MEQFLRAASTQKQKYQIDFSLCLLSYNRDNLFTGPQWRKNLQMFVDA